MSKILALKAEERLEYGKGIARKLRADKKVPAIIYGKGKKKVSFAISEKEITLEYNKPGFLSHIFNIEVGNIKYRAIPKEVQLHPVTDNVLHVDFMHIGEHDKIKVVVPLHFINKEKSVGIKKGGILNIARHDIELNCHADAIPEHIEVDILDFEVGSVLHVGDIKLPEGSETALDNSVTIASIALPRGVKEESEEEGTEEKSTS